LTAFPIILFHKIQKISFPYSDRHKVADVEPVLCPINNLGGFSSCNMFFSAFRIIFVLIMFLPIGFEFVPIFFKKNLYFLYVI